MSRFVISKEFRFSAAHRLTGLPGGHPCARVHGHNWVVTLSAAGTPDSAGMVVDYGKLKVFGQWLDANLDHRWLGNGPILVPPPDWLDAPADQWERWTPVLDFNPTAELLAEYLHGIAQSLGLPWVRSVTVCETPSTTARYE